MLSFIATVYSAHDHMRVHTHTHTPIKEQLTS